jgi:hypothetical protein
MIIIGAEREGHLWSRRYHGSHFPITELLEIHIREMYWVETRKTVRVSSHHTLTR